MENCLWKIVFHAAMCFHAAMESTTIRSISETTLYIVHSKENEERKGQFQNAHSLVVVGAGLGGRPGAAINLSILIWATE